MASFGQSVTIVYYAYNTSTGGYQTGDVANHTLKLLKDGTEASPSNSPAEIDATNWPGAYSLVLTTGEAQHNIVALGGKSSTSNVIIIGTTISFEQLPTATPGSSGGVLIAGTNAATTITGSLTTTFTGNLTGSVVSVTGAVGSVTGNVGGSVASVTGAVGSVTGNVGGNVTGSVGSISGITFPTHFSALAITTGGAVTVGAYASGEDPATLVWAQVLETGITVLQGLRYTAAAAAGVASGAATTTFVLDAIGNAATARITATVDANGNRSAVVLS